MMKHINFTKFDIDDEFSTKITNAESFQFQQRDITCLRAEFHAFLLQLIDIYTKEKAKEKKDEDESRTDDDDEAKLVLPNRKKGTRKKDCPYILDQAEDKSDEEESDSDDGEEQQKEEDEKFIDDDTYDERPIKTLTAHDHAAISISKLVNEAGNLVHDFITKTGSTDERLISIASKIREVQTKVRDLDGGVGSLNVHTHDEDEEDSTQTYDQEGTEQHQQETPATKKEDGDNDNQKGHDDDLKEDDVVGPLPSFGDLGSTSTVQASKFKEKKLRYVSGSTLMTQVNELKHDYKESGADYVIAELDIAQTLSKLVHLCFGQINEELCLVKLKEGVQCAIDAMSHTVQAMIKFVTAPQINRDEKLALAFETESAVLGGTLNAIDSIIAGNILPTEDGDSNKEELVNIQTAIWRLQNPNQSTIPDLSKLDSKVGQTSLKRYLTLGNQARNMLLHCLHILLIDRVIDELVLSKAVSHWSESESKQLHDNLNKLAAVTGDKIATDEINDMTIKTILNKLILPAIMLKEKAEEKSEEAEETPMWKLATKVLISIFVGLVGPDARVKSFDDVKELYDENILSVFKKALAETVNGSSTKCEDDYCCDLSVKMHTERRRRIIYVYLLLLLQKPMERALGSCEFEQLPIILKELNNYFGSYSGSLLRFAPAELYSRATFIGREDFFLEKMTVRTYDKTKKFFDKMKSKGNYEKKHLLITSSDDMETLERLAGLAYSSGAHEDDDDNSAVAASDEDGVGMVDGGASSL